MAQIRRNSVTGEYVCISETRKHRPVHISEKSRPCPFCPENAHMTPASVYETDNVRAFFNLYPILDDSDPSGFGRHEVIVDTKIHNELFHDFDYNHAKETLSALMNRVSVFYLDSQIEYVQVFKNEGANSGATIPHSHWQIVGMPFMPFYQSAMIAGVNKPCPVCEMLHTKELTVYENEHAVAYCPKDARFGYEINASLKRHFSSYEEITDSEIRCLADCLRKSAKAIYENCSKDYNICFQQLFKRETGLHFFIQIIPRLGRLGGFELATYSYTHSDYPEDYAQMFKNSIAKTDNML